MKSLVASILVSVIYISSVLAQKLPAASVQQRDWSKLIVGKWSGAKEQTLSFASDGSYSVEPYGINGRWRIEGDQLLLTSEGRTLARQILYLRDDELGFERKGDVERCSRIRDHVEPPNGAMSKNGRSAAEPSAARIPPSSDIIAEAKPSAGSALEKAKRAMQNLKGLHVRDLRIGSTFGDVVKFCSENQLQIIPEQEEIVIPGRATKSFFTRELRGSNGKTGVDNIELTCIFEPPIPEKDESRMTFLRYSTRFGAGVNIAKLADDLEAKYGKSIHMANARTDALMWQISSGNDGSVKLMVNFEAPAVGGEYGTVHFQMTAEGIGGLLAQAYREAIQEIDARRSKDQTMPKF